jgi:hypothetical protein
MFDFHSGNLPATFEHYFQPVNQRHNYNTILAAQFSYCLPQARTNNGLFNIQYAGPKIWNSVDENVKSISRVNLLSQFVKMFYKLIFKTHKLYVKLNIIFI